ncbi:hypothetical protein AU184_01065 [Mycolicibacterium novocastrense]|uniref:hypothetical protein n=1 Tax=Mycolicibacterium novocastrense TaxID=59813 RepID=UPI000748D2B3|nr:hypothetical protein [Mycolicibacterium novocastrense]KUH66402.1 hypothetical protein AU184_01065 [Mycolicibacterium novocastrense]KUH72756.1 hypothetical protein AU072_19520 [Mycolicibacterium novocastrense]KUH74945.1 hypothetical protein AU183_06560 [Mycolicibacterium novocastrense]
MTDTYTFKPLRRCEGLMSDETCGDAAAFEVCENGDTLDYMCDVHFELWLEYARPMLGNPARAM